MKNEVGKWYKYEELGDKGDLYVTRHAGLICFGLYLGRDPGGRVWWGATPYSRDAGLLVDGSLWSSEHEMLFLKICDNLPMSEADALGAIKKALV
jgi:hypothetical protein